MTASRPFVRAGPIDRSDVMPSATDSQPRNACGVGARSESLVITRDTPARFAGASCYPNGDPRVFRMALTCQSLCEVRADGTVEVHSGFRDKLCPVNR